MTADPAAGKRPNSSRPKTDPTCPVPPDGKHNSVRAARGGCTCSGARIAHERDRDRDRSKSRARRQRDAEQRVAARVAVEQEAARHAAGKKARRAEREAAKKQQQEEEEAVARGPRLDARPSTRLEKALRERSDLACRDEDPELFFPVQDGHAARPQELAAKRICGRCPALDMCGTVSLQVLPSHGVMGGFSAADRRHLRAKGWAA